MVRRSREASKRRGCGGRGEACNLLGLTSPTSPAASLRLLLFPHNCRVLCLILLSSLWWPPIPSSPSSPSTTLPQVSACRGKGRDAAHCGQGPRFIRQSSIPPRPPVRSQLTDPFRTHLLRTEVQLDCTQTFVYTPAYPLLILPRHSFLASASLLPAPLHFHLPQAPAVLACTAYRLTATRSSARRSGTLPSCRPMGGSCQVGGEGVQQTSGGGGFTLGRHRKPSIPSGICPAAVNSDAVVSFWKFVLREASAAPALNSACSECHRVDIDVQPFT